MVAARPSVSKVRAKRRGHGYYSRVEHAAGDAHRDRMLRRTKAGVPQGRHGKVTPAGKAKLQAKARKQPRDVLGRFASIVDKADKRAYEEAIWGRVGRRVSDYPKKRTPTGQAHSGNRAKSRASLKGAIGRYGSVKAAMRARGVNRGA